MKTEEKENIDKKIKQSALKEKEVRGRLKDLNDWRLSSDGDKISREIDFKSFRKAIDFVNEVAGYSEKINHHPAVITIKFNKVKVELTTSEVEGLTKKDFVLAEEIDLIADWKASFKRWLSSTKVITVLLIIFLLMLLWRYVL